MMELVAIVKVTVNGRLTLPKEVRERLSIKDGDRLKVYVTEGKIILER